MGNRVVAVFAIFLLLFAIVLCSLALISSNLSYAQSAEQQAAFQLTLDDGRGKFFDCHFKPLTENKSAEYALLAPTTESYFQMFDAVPEENRAALYQSIQKNTPFLTPVETLPEDVDTFLFSKQMRYQPAPIAQHLIGYRNGDGKGVTGLEGACEALLKGGATRRDIYGITNVYGAFVPGKEPRVIATQGTGNGVMLTLDETLQRVCEGVAAENIDKGSIVVMECATGRIRASVSAPTFDVNDIAQSLKSTDGAMMNRSISAYSVGSVFKPLLAAAALENGIDPEEIYQCTGSIDINGHIYRCAYGKGHGEVTLSKALDESCNCYFVQLGLRLGGNIVEEYAARAGFGESTPIYGALRTARGNLPDAQTLENLGELASISFGQGKLLASPVQMAAFTNIFANAGVYIAPTFVEGIVNEYTQTVTKSLYTPLRRQVIDSSTAEAVKAMMIHVVEEGLGKSAKPVVGGAGGKTGTAQTGRENKDGEEIMDAWFTGFYPAENPRYTIVVLLDENTHSGEDACKIFAKVADSLRFFIPELDK